MSSKLLKAAQTTRTDQIIAEFVSDDSLKYSNGTPLSLHNGEIDLEQYGMCVNVHVRMESISNHVLLSQEGQVWPAPPISEV